MADSVLINGMQISWSSASLTLAGEKFTGVTGIKYGDGLETGKAYGMGRSHAPRGRPAGKYVTENLVLTMYTASAEELRSMLAKRSDSGTSYGDVEFAAALQYIERNEKPITVEFDRCRYVKESSSDEESSDALTVDVELDVMSIKRNGLTLYRQSKA